MHIADSDYAMGRAHRVCQDYALARNDSRALAIVADGCSGSADSDIGARLLANISAQKLKTAPPPGDELADIEVFAHTIAFQAAAAARLADLSPEALDSTLLAAVADNSIIHVIVYGDGWVISRDRAGHWRTVEISFTHNAPYYLSYRTDAERARAYAALSRSERKHILDSDGILSAESDCQEPTLLAFDAKSTDVLAIVSDGLSSFYDAAQHESIAVIELIEPLLLPKNRNPGFAQRRLRRALKTAAAAGQFPSDDLAVGVLAQVGNKEPPP